MFSNIQGIVPVRLQLFKSRYRSLFIPASCEGNVPPKLPLIERTSVMMYMKTIQEKHSWSACSWENINLLAVIKSRTYLKIEYAQCCQSLQTNHFHAIQVFLIERQKLPYVWVTFGFTMEKQKQYENMKNNHDKTHCSWREILESPLQTYCHSDEGPLWHKWTWTIVI